MLKGVVPHRGLYSVGLSVLLCNQNWFAPQLCERGHKVVTAGPPGRGFDIAYSHPSCSLQSVLAALPSGFKPDRFVYFDDSGPIWLTGLEALDVPSLFYSIDAHHHSNWHRHFAAAFDAVLVSQKDYLAEIQQRAPFAEWFPLWAPDILTPAAERPLDVTFRGTLNRKVNTERVEFFERLGKLVNIDACQGDFRDVYPRSKIVINQAVRRDFNFRVFEALSSGALLITPHVDNGLLDLFVPGEDIVTYELNNVEEAADKIRYFLAHEDERARIAERGYLKLCEFHTAGRRGLQFEAKLRDLSRARRPTRFSSLALSYLYAGEISRRNGSEISSKTYLKHAAKLLSLSMINSEPSQREQEEIALVLKTSYEAQQMFIELAEVAANLLSQMPENVVYAAIAADALKKAQEQISRQLARS
jgi:hypothetical protein